MSLQKFIKQYRNGMSHSSSTSRLIIPRWKQRIHTPQDNLATSGKYASTEGRFTIIDERRKESTTSISSDSSSDGELIRKKSKAFRTKIKGWYPTNQKVLPPSSPLKKSNPMIGSRFKIVPVDSKYKRGRWNCWDYYDPEPRVKTNQLPPLLNKFSTSLTTSAFKSIEAPSMIRKDNDTAPLTAPVSREPPSVSFTFDFSDDSEDDNQSGDEKEQALSTRPPQSSPRAVPLLDVKTRSPESNGTMDVDSAISGRMTPVEMLHNFGLERSLSATYNDKFLDLLPGTIPPVGSPLSTAPNAPRESTSSAPGGNSPVIAIDSKIEQAMDLVKTHLMFAVREEVEVLRAKIIELEATILQLESENAILREHVPAEILSKLSLQTPSPPSATTAAV